MTDSIPHGYHPTMVALGHSGALERMMQHSAGNLTPDVARVVLMWKFDDSDQKRLSELLSQARSGNLSADETRELDWYLLLGDFLTIVQSKARVALRNNTSAA